MGMDLPRLGIPFRYQSFFFLPIRQSGQFPVDNLVHDNIGYEGYVFIDGDSTVGTRVILTRQRLSMVQLSISFEPARPTPFTLIHVHAHGPQKEWLSTSARYHSNSGPSLPARD